MTHAYDEIYLPDAQMNLAVMLDFAVNDLCLDVSVFFEQFISYHWNNAVKWLIVSCVCNSNFFCLVVVPDSRADFRVYIII